MTETTNVTDSRKELNEIRRNNLELIRLRYGSMSAVNVAVGRKCTDSTFTQTRNRVFNSSTQQYGVLPRDGDAHCAGTRREASA